MKSKPRTFPLMPRALFTIVGGAILINPAFAQDAPAGDAEEIDTITVTGLRSSLISAMATKRDAIGVVDAIKAEDIGKFPDTNLSESLQRITGVSIDRRNGEGALVTARGFGPGYNMVTLNGRQMPSADAYANGSANYGGVTGNTRAFNFANLSADAVSAVEVYKTGRADVATGGIGATVNIRTARPLDGNGDLVASFGVKAINDTTTEFGDDITPEVSGIFSWANEAQNFGVGLNASYSKRDSGSVQSTVNGWDVRPWAGPDSTMQAGVTIVNAPEVGQLYAEPQDLRYAYSETSRERINGQLALQFAPIEGLSLTLDGTFAQNEISEDRSEQGQWLGRNDSIFYIEFDDSAVASPIVLRELAGAGKDMAFAQQHRDQKNDLRSIGFNADWDVSENFNLSFDAHNSRARSLPNDPVTGGGQTEFSVAGRVPDGPSWVQEFNFNSGLPVARRTLYASAAAALAGTGGNTGYDFNSGSIGTQMLTMDYQAQITDLKQVRLDGEFSFEKGKFAFGVESRAVDSTQHVSGPTRSAMGNWGVADAGTPTGAALFNQLVPFSITGTFDDFNPINGGASPGAFRGNATQLGLWALDNYTIDYDQSTGPDGELRYDPGFSTNSTVQEDTKALYAQLAFELDLGGREANLVVGARYEETTVFSLNNLLQPNTLIWQDDNDFTIINDTVQSPVVGNGSYNNLLPNLDFDMRLTESMKARFSYSKTISRAGYNALSAGQTTAQGGQGSSLLGFFPRAQQNNPDLQPLESDNFDVSLEYYFSDKGYVSLAAFQKNVENFIGNEVIMQGVYGVQDPTGGPRAQAARSWLQSNGFAVTNASLFTAMLMTENPGGAWNGTNNPDVVDVFLPGGLANYNNSSAQQTAWGNALTAGGLVLDILPAADDPEAMFGVNTATNNQEAKIHGFEVGGQYFFGDSGFGVLANYTIVKGDVDFNDAGDPNVNQFALLGLSDSANAVLMFEKYGISARLAYNWRDEFLQSANDGSPWRNPIYVEAYDQIDLSVGYDFTESFAVSFEAINLTGEDVRWHGRSILQMHRVEDQGARYALGARYKF
jgi:TonB-dependent receptor